MATKKKFAIFTQMALIYMHSKSCLNIEKIFWRENYFLVITAKVLTIEINILAGEVFFLDLWKSIMLFWCVLARISSLLLVTDPQGWLIDRKYWYSHIYLGFIVFDGFCSHGWEKTALSERLIIQQYLNAFYGQSKHAIQLVTFSLVSSWNIHDV